MIQVKNELLQALQEVLTQMAPGAAPPAAFESPKLAAHGDLAVTAAMPLARALKKNPRELAQALIDALQRCAAVQRWVQGMEIAGAGFVNLRLSDAAKQTVVAEVLRAGSAFGRRPTHAQRVLVEFVSANPTGPLHVGHAHQAALGDSICNLFDAQGWQVQREFYYNDAGVQIATLASSVQHRLMGLKPGDAGWPENAYNGEYIADIATAFLARASVKADDREFTASGDVADLDNIREFAVAYLRHEQDLDLQAFGVRFDHYFLESSLYSSGRVEATVQRLVDAGKTYEKDGALWLRSTDYGDDKDRVMRKSAAAGTGDADSVISAYTYFVPDVAYHIDKFERGFDKVIDVQGSDHHGTIARVRAGLQAVGLGIPPGFPDYLLHKMVTVMRGGIEVKISKRAGGYVTLRDLIDWTSRDAVRFFLSSRKADTEFVFDIDLALKANDENPVFYVQYAHARICSVLAQYAAQENARPPEVSLLPLGGAEPAPSERLRAREWLARDAGPASPASDAATQRPWGHADLGGDLATLPDARLQRLVAPSELNLMLKLADYPDMLVRAAAELAPHAVAFYLRDLSAHLHSYYAAERFLVGDAELAGARMALLAATRQVMRNALQMLGVSAPQAMERSSPVLAENGA